MQSPITILSQYWGYPAFRGNQETIISDVLQGKDILAMMPTGGGKSICYQVPALIMDGICLVVSPLIALMQDQVARLKELGISAACIHAGMHTQAVIRVLDNAVQGAYKLLYVSPERLQTTLFNEYLPAMQISFIAVDEAHCVSQWGHDFRPDYLKIALIKEELDDIPFLCLTATATTAVQNDIALQLKLQKPILYTQSFERKNIYYKVHYTENKQKELLEALSLVSTSSIVYCRSRKQTEVLVGYLAQNGLEAICYHAGMAKNKREDAQLAWMQGKVKTIIATTAFGMGIDKQDVGLVVNYDAPEHIEAYYQESGRAGRNGQPAKSLILYNQTDINRLERSVEIQFPSIDYLRQVYQCVAEYLQVPISAEPYRYYDFDLKDFCEKFKLDAAIASNALKILEQEGLWTLTEAVFNPPTVFVTSTRQELDNVINTYPELAHCLTTLLRLYGSLFQYPTAIRIVVIAKQMKTIKEQVEKILCRLHGMGMLEYIPQKEGPQLFFHHYRVDSKQLIINTDRIAKLKKRYEERTNAIITYLHNNSQCRTRLLLAYFDEQKQTDCGHCDVCATRQKQNINNDNLHQSILQQATIPVNIHTIVAQLYSYDKQLVMSSIRRMVDEKKLRLSADGTVTKN